MWATSNRGDWRNPRDRGPLAAPFWCSAGCRTEVFASAVTIGLAHGSGLAFEGQGQKEIKGLDRPIEVYRLA
jgi:hypothetical protein